MRRLAALVVLVVALVGSPAPARAELVGAVSEIRVLGNIKVEEAAIRAIVGLEVGDIYRPEAVRQAIRDIYRLGHFRDIWVEGEQDGAGVVLFVHVVEKPSIREVVFQGNEKVQIDDITEVVTIQSFTILDEAKVVANAHRIEEVYLDKGYYLVEVEHSVQQLEGNEVNVVFDIRENRKVLIKQIDIVGNAAFPDSRLKMFMQTKEAGILPGAGKAGTYKQDVLLSDIEQLTAFYVEFGYLNVRVGTPEVTLSPNKRWVFITVPVEEGDQYSIGEVTIDGDIIFPEPELYELVKIESGEPWRRSRIMEDQQALTDKYADQGYAFANVVPLPATDPERKVADIRYMIQKGNLVTLDRIRIIGNETTWDKVIRREIDIDEGDLWRGSTLMRSRYRLERLGYFEEVKITTPRGDEPDTLDMVVDVTEQPTGTFSVGAGISTIERFVFTANISRANFLGLGYYIAFAANLSLGSNLQERGFFYGQNSRQMVQLDIYDPYFLDTRFNFRFAGFSRVMDYGLREFNRGITVAIGHYIGKQDDARFAVEYTLEDLGLTSLREYQQNFLGGQFYRSGKTSSLQASIILDKRNNRITPTKGIYTSAAVEFAGGFRTDPDTVVSILGGDFRFLRLQGNFRTYIPLGTPLVVLRWNLSLGYVKSLDGSVVPYTIRYRAGGINSLRGYLPYSVGPYFRWMSNDDPVHAAEGIVLGGNASIINNLEVEFPLVPPAGVKGVVFFDAGDAFGGLYGTDPFSFENLRLSAGFGIRWHSPMGPLRFEWGFPINRRPHERDQVFEFTIGSFF